MAHQSKGKEVSGSYYIVRCGVFLKTLVAHQLKIAALNLNSESLKERLKCEPTAIR